MNLDRFNVNVSLSKNWDHLQSKFAGTGHPDTTKYEWAVNQHRDTHATFLGHQDLLSYLAVAQGISIERARIDSLQRMVQPCGLPPARDAELSESKSDQTAQ